ncbi:lysylphosphatidylglycerol synthase transmembrane domain-containing protein [Skermanella pratensis]|uniref:lysylphosphatidylglycerol synthase transmembrane domain-containing protein n=1 Tax=Skermanella pratensis TaxID=2233999 RepID=UPI0013012F23|nr:lysylphosphatidylglycerol synthase transmembrane domain-containing protein [Skermanella pratensis]
MMRRAEYGAVITAVVFVAAMTAAGIWFGLDEVWHRMWALSPAVLAGLLLLSLVNYALRAWRWHLFGHHLGIDVPAGRTGLYYVAGFAMTTTPGKVGEALRLWLLERCHGYRYERTAPLLIGDRMGDAVAITLLCLTGLSSFGAAYGAGTLVATAALAGGLLMLLRPQVPLRAVLLAYGLVGRWPRLFGGARTVVRKTSRLLDPRIFALTSAMGVVGWLCEAYALHWLLTDLGAQITLQQAIFVFAFAMLVGAVSMLPGGLGGTEATMFALLTLLGVPADTALAATLIIRLTTLWFAVVLGFAALPVALKLARQPAAERLATADGIR